MLRLLMIVSGGFEALFGASAILATPMLVGTLGTEAGTSALFFARMLGAATLGIGIAALLARNELASPGGLAVAYGLALGFTLDSHFFASAVHLQPSVSSDAQIASASCEEQGST
jgi:hypothetical protein